MSMFSQTTKQALEQKKAAEEQAAKDKEYLGDLAKVLRVDGLDWSPNQIHQVKRTLAELKRQQDSIARAKAERGAQPRTPYSSMAMRHF